MFHRSKYLAVAAVILCSSFSAPLMADHYSSKISQKLTSGISNMALGWVEIPKNVINTANESNLALAAMGGVVKGVLHTIGRTLSGAVDLLTFPFPTTPITQPLYVWENFNIETSYGRILQKSP
jgi:putative exosortase-associated protein (TIGR04073 family)